jgi:sodium/potassium-transporting ATPase subunit alpha
MDTNGSPHVEKSPVPLSPAFSEDEALAATRTVAFNQQEHVEISEEKLHHGHLRPRGVEMKREMTKEDKELAAAGYEHLEEQKTKGKKGEPSDLDKVDIQEHHLDFVQLPKALDTNVDTKDPGSSYGLTSEEAKARLARDGQNILTPPKKKSALRKVSSAFSRSWATN